MQISLPFNYDFERALERLAGDPVNAVDLQKREVKIPMEEGNVITLRGLGTTDSPSFLLENAIDESQVDKVKSFFHFDRRLDTVSDHFRDTNLEKLFVEHAGTPLIKEFSLYGTLMKSIIHQQLNLAFSHVLTMRFVENSGENQDGVWRYPEPEKIAALKVEDLRQLQFSGRKAEYVIGLSRAIVDGNLDLNKFEKMEDEEIIHEMVAHRGIGPWTAQNFLMFGLGRPNLFPIADIGLQNALKNIWAMDRKPTKEEIMEQIPIWKPYLSYAALYLWRSIE
ncbi:DNA-3-methyladenine glycosylase [Sporosarcina thermotolerans]|uniref:DNA-3-methyladenine glycosylase II n=1 Tax=Sporosarcina thermotolerans TaxID=633404 RepID=A0AAW9A9W7_9BACL|nr:DNA-3-methyladenine glycosylase [Sporosarcina thermotolerans]MDW0115923.1 DNA-3-methyladenine glycosylase [Sporosarcina thermotolerans]WHT46860.1 DNA-3-methyladenine glycosylase [Sporosarcina thermotolerans]